MLGNSLTIRWASTCASRFSRERAEFLADEVGLATHGRTSRGRFFSRMAN